MKVAKQYNCEFLSHGCKQSTSPLGICLLSSHTDSCLSYLHRHRKRSKFLFSLYIMLWLLTLN